MRLQLVFARVETLSRATIQLLHIVIHEVQMSDGHRLRLSGDGHDEIESNRSRHVDGGK